MKDALQTGCLAAGVLCIIYYVIIISYAGISTDMAFLWVFAGAASLLLNRLLYAQNRYPQMAVLRAAADVLLLLAAAALAVLLVGGSLVVRGMLQKPRAGLDYVIVLGAQVRGSKPSRALRRRLDEAADYAAENPDTVFILSGGKGDDEEISEAQCMYNYLTGEKGLDASRLLLEDQSSSTQENLLFSAEYLDKEKSTGIISNNFHIFRALAIARAQGYADPVGIPASSDLLMQPHNILREICCLLAQKVLGQI